MGCPLALHDALDFLGLTLASQVSIKRILNLNHNVESDEADDGTNPDGPLRNTASAILSSDGEPIWKVLVFDDLGRDVISSVLRVSDLRSMGVTMHMSVLCPRLRSARLSWLARTYRTNTQAHWRCAQPHSRCPRNIPHRADVREPARHNKRPREGTLLSSSHQLSFFDT